MTAHLPLEGIRVVDESQGPIAGLATLVLADFGATVIKVEPPGGDPFRTLPSAPLWLRGKQSAVLQPGTAADRAALLALAGQTDVWVRGPAPADPALSDEDLARANPRLIIGWVSAFGRTGPYAGYPASEALVAAKAGRMLQFRGSASRPGPVYAALQVATHAASQSLLAGVLAALRAQARDGLGQVIETSLLRGLLPYEMNNVLAAQVNAQRRARGEAELPAPPDPMVAMPTLNYHPVQTADGHWLQLGNLLPHLFMSFVRAIGLADELAALGVSGPTELWPDGPREAFRDRILQRLQEKTLAQWQSLFIADGGVASHPYQSTQQALDDPDVVANGHSLPLGADGRQLGLLANLTLTPGQAGAPAPAVGEHTAQVRAQIAQAVAAATPARSAPEPAASPVTSSPTSSSTSSLTQSLTPSPTAFAPRRTRDAPLAGVTIVEAATIIAAPFAAALLADMGARVIKFEPLEGDPFRSMAPGLGAARVNTGKECIALDLKNPRAREIAQTIVASADLFLHNYRPGVPERLGLGYEQLAARNPRLVYLSANGYGPRGPGALRPSTHPIPGAAMGGVLHHIGGAPGPALMNLAQLRETARRLMRANDVNPDPNTSLVICSAALLGLTAQRRFGVGQAIFVDMFGANAYANFDDALRYPGKAPRATPDRDGFGLDPLWRLYPCARGWVFIGVSNAAEWNRFRELAGASALAPQDVDGARAGGAAVVDALTALFAGADAATWETRLAPHGVGCVQADGALPETFLRDDPQARAEALLLPARHGEWGEYQRHGAQVVFQGTPGTYRGTGLAGACTDALLAEFGIDAAGARELRASGAVA
jgi:crotonobetainyl-CoA:carnitine CoA-transferase CaiB-like acyl-CoA transferase